MTKEEIETAKAYALARNTIKPGDVITDHSHTIQVNKIGVSVLGDPFCVYAGVELKRDGAPKRDQMNTHMRQVDVISINGNPTKK